MVVVGRIPFPFTLIDKRHQPFVDGRCDTLLTLPQVVSARKLLTLIPTVFMGLLFLFFGGYSIVYDHSVTWKTADAVITNVRSALSGNRNNYWYFYEFKTEAGEMVSNYIVDDHSDAHSSGDVVPVYYVESDPKDNYYADDPLPRAFRDWFLVGLSAIILGSSVYMMRSSLSDYRALARLSHVGQPIQGEIIKSQPLLKPDDVEVEIDYAVKMADGKIAVGAVTMSPQQLSQRALPSVGTKVAIWYAEKEGAVLL
jgi:Protein of unknown function (DUF3592)